MTTVLTTPAELQEFLNDEAKVKAAATDGTLNDTLKATAVEIVKRDKTIKEQVDIEVQRQTAKWIEDNGGDTKQVPVNLSPDTVKRDARKLGNRIKIQNFGMEVETYAPSNGHGLGKKADGIFTDAAELFQAASESWDKCPGRDVLLQKRNQMRDIQNSYGSLVPADGGFLIPDEYRDELLMLSLESSVVRPRATVIPMSSLRLAMPAVDETTHSGSVRGGIQFFWGEEGAGFTETQSKFARVQLEAKKLYGYLAPPNELFADAPSFGRFIDQVLPEGIAWFEDIAFMTGSGVGEPLGWNSALNAARILYDVAVSSQISWPDVVNMYARMLPSSLGKAVWLCSPDAFPQLAQMTFGSGSFPALFTVGGGTGAPSLSLLGRPVIVTEKASALGTDGCLAFVDLSYYLIGDRQMMQAEQSRDYLFGSDKTAIRIVERVDGRPWIQSAITPQNGSSNTLSPFVVAQGLHT